MGFWSWVGQAIGLGNAADLATFSVEPGDVREFMPVNQTIVSLTSALGPVTRERALTVSSVQKGRNLICSVATLPLRQVDPDNRVVRSSLLDQFDPNVPNIVHMSQTIEDLLFDAVSWWRVLARDFEGYPTQAQHLTTGTVTVNPPIGRTLSPLPSGLDPREGSVWVDGVETRGRDVIRFDSPNPGLLRVGSRAIRRAILLDATAELYANSPYAREFFTAADGVDPDDDEEISEFLREWSASRRNGTAAYVPAMYKHETATTISPADLQLIELSRGVSLDLANAIGVDPEDLGVSTTSRTYANAVDRRIDKANEVLAPFMRAVTDRLSMGDVTKRGRQVVFNLDDYLKSNPIDRWAIYEKAKNMGVLDVPEIRQIEKLPPAMDGATAGGDGATVTSLPTGGVAASAGRNRIGFDDDAPEVHHFRIDGATHRFTVDGQRRVISGLALPYNAIGMKYGLKFRFLPGSLEYDATRVKHYKDHVTPVGVALSLNESDANLSVELSVARGATGDELLQLAEDRVYDGLSVGTEFSLDPDDGDIALADDGVYDVHRATLREVSTTPMPAFDDARVTKVAANRTSGGTMKCTKCSQVHANGVTECRTVPATVEPTAAVEPTFTATQVAEFSADQLAAYRLLYAPASADADKGPTVVNPVVGRTATEVTDPAPYGFDRKGNLVDMAHSFAKDVISASKNDVDALTRVNDFVVKQFAISTGNVDELNPTRQRPEMYVDQRQFKYPIWETINKGTLTDITPFVFPAFNSASGLVANHTEGTEPTSGTFTTKNGGTVTPTAISGKVEINREVWDQGGNPQVSNLIWQKMIQGWYEALEAFAVALLDATTPTAITLTAGAANDALVDELTAALALLNFVRGGFTMDNAFTQVDLYKALVAAKGDDGRKLLPIINPMNADGTVRSRWSAVDVGGVLFLPAWALAASGAVAASSYLFDRESVWGWASTPQRINIEYQVKSVEIGLWGYKAGVVTDLAGVREIIYDPTA